MDVVERAQQVHLRAGFAPTKLLRAHLGPALGRRRLGFGRISLPLLREGEGGRRGSGVGDGEVDEAWVELVIRVHADVTVGAAIVVRLGDEAEEVLAVERGIDVALPDLVVHTVEEQRGCSPVADTETCEGLQPVEV